MRVVVVGGGISGLTTALTLAEQAGDAVQVEVREASDRLGGKLLTSPFAGRPGVDEGADSFLARVPHATALATRLGVDLTAPEPLNAAIWHRRLHDIPAGLLLGVPANLRGLARSRLLSWRGKLRAAIEPVLPHRADPDDSVGSFVRARFGDEVHVRLVDALVGSIYAADTDRYSLAMVPQLTALSSAHRSALVGARRTARAAAAATGRSGDGDSPPPVFHAPVAGMGALADAVADAARAAGVTIRTGRPVGDVAADGTGWRVDDDAADAVVLAGPAAAAALVVRDVPALADLLAAVDHAGVTIVTVAVGEWPERLAGRSGYLVPKDVQRTVTAASFGSQKWAHWRDPASEVLRISLGRDGLVVDDLDDDGLVDRAVTEVGAHLALDLQPTATRISRWPGAFPQYRPHHRRWLDAVDAATPTGLFLTGASYRGIGVPACVADAERTAGAVAAYLRDTSGQGR